MIGTSWHEYIFIRVSVFLLEYSPPLCSLGLGLALFATRVRTPSPAGAVSVAWAFGGMLALETAFALTIYYPFKARLRTEARHPPLPIRAKRERLFYKCIANVPEPEHYLRFLFLGAAPSEIKRENMREFLLWAFFDRDSSQDPDPEVEEELAIYIREMELLLGRALEDGRGSATCLRPTLDVVETRYRSVAWYFIVGLVDLATHCLFLGNGFHYHAPPLAKRLAIFPPRPQLWVPRGSWLKSSPTSEFGYWHLPHTATNSVPVVFLHGIGIGLWPYTKFLTDLNLRQKGSRNENGQIGIIALELLPISMRFTSDPLGRAMFLDHVSAIIAHHGWDRFILVAHSYGSVLATHMVRSPSLGPKIESMVLIDPVSLLLHLPDVAFNFTRRLPRRANEWQLWFFASMDPGVAHTLGRHFFWRENVIWKEELLQRGDGMGSPGSGPTSTRSRRKVAVCLAGVT